MENKFKKDSVQKIDTITAIRAKFRILDANLKVFGKTKCKYRCKREKTIMECQHPSMAYGGMAQNFNCELVNCPRLIYGDD